MEMDFVTLTQENLDREQLCCIVRTKKPHPGVERKRAWLRERIREGHVFRKLAGNDCAFIEYAPIETAWAPVEGEDYLYLYCLWVQGAPRGQGVGKALPCPFNNWAVFCGGRFVTVNQLDGAGVQKLLVRS